MIRVVTSLLVEALLLWAATSLERLVVSAALVLLLLATVEDVSVELGVVVLLLALSVEPGVVLVLPAIVEEASVELLVLALPEIEVDESVALGVVELLGLEVATLLSREVASVAPMVLVLLLLLGCVAALSVAYAEPVWLCVLWLLSAPVCCEPLMLAVLEPEALEVELRSELELLGEVEL